MLAAIFLQKKKLEKLLGRNIKSDDWKNNLKDNKIM